MTALGFLLMALSWCVAELSDHINIQKWIKLSAAYSFGVGFGLIITGVTTWLWKVMP